MDQSKEETSDRELRVISLNLAMNALKGPEIIPGDVIMEAREYYLFLARKDPTIDLNADIENVVNLAEARRNV